MGVDWGAIASAAVGTTTSAPALAEMFEIDDEDELEQQLGALGVEVCSGCGWWFHDVMRHPDLLCEDCVHDA